jgi:amino acid adenylation domain-containing protein
VLAWLRKIQDEQSQLQQFEYSSLIDIQGWSEIPRGVPLFESIFVFENLPVMSSHKPESTATEIVEDRGLGSTTGYPLTLLVSPGTKMAAQIVYDRTRFDAAVIRRLLGHYEQLLVNLTADPHQFLSRVQLLTSAEHQQILQEWNNTELALADSRSLIERFEEQAERHPHAPAVIFGNEELSYEEFNSHANRLARYLKRFGVGADRRVAICMERSFEMVVAVMATLKAGGAYVPLDPHYPAERLRFMLADSTCVVVLTGNQVALPETNTSVLNVHTVDTAQEDDSNLEEKILDEQLAYIIYTSGSTGQPKGVAMPHGALRNLIGWQLQPPFTAARTAQFSSFSFDVSFQELFSTWCSGGALVLLSEEVRRDAIQMLEFLRSQRVERLFLPFIYLQHLAEAATANGIFPETLRDVITAGEQLEITASIREIFERLPNCRLHNQYGPSESHVATAYTLTGPVGSWMALPPIGRAIGNTQIYVVDRNLNLLPAGVSGELLIAGANVSRGYLERPDATAAKFIPDPFGPKPGARLYRTGDLARYRADGQIEFLGRIDNQVKIRGFRIELGEIEAALIDNSAVRQAAVVAREGIGARELVAYLVVDETPGDGIERELRSHLKTRLPDYMVPAHFVFLDALPLTSSGKVNRGALPAPELSFTSSGSFQEPVTPEQVQLAEIWETVLQRQPIGITDNFFELGGHSLLATQLVSRVRQVFEVDLPLRCLFDSPTIAELAESLKKFESKEKADTRIIAAETASKTNDLLANLDEMSDSEVEALLNDLLAEQN